MLLTLCQEPLVEKTRCSLEYGGLIWEIDVFSGRAEGLVLAEVELTDANQPIELPQWIGAEVTHDRRYRNTEIAEAGAPAPER